ncbi:unnamed protein product [Schistosoma turkestanicum]|nr:unnamed protein product [Schistosoma turkestanicum]
MKTTGCNIASIFDAKFPGKLDDTLINRLCRSVVCQHEYHTEFWSTVPISEWDLVSKHACRWDIDYDCTTELDVILKAAVSLSFRYGLIFGNEDAGPHKIVLYALNKSDKNIDITLIETLANCLKSIKSLTDINVVSWIKSPKVLTLLQNLSRESNVHVFKNTIIVCAFIFLHFVDSKLDINQKPLDECFQLSAFGIEVLLVIAELTQKFNIEFDTLQISEKFQFTVTNFNLFPSELQAKLLFLVFTRIVSSPSSNNDWVSFLKSLQNLPELCASVINLYLKSNKKMCDEMWKFIINEWSLSLYRCLENAEAANVLRIINPVCLYSDASLHIESGSNLLKKILTILMKNPNSSEVNDVQKYHTRLWVLSRMFIHSSPPSSIVSLSDVTDVVDYLIFHCNSTISYPSISKLDAAFNFFKEICLVFWNSEQSTIGKLMLKLFDSILTIDNSRLFSVFSFHFIHLIQKLSCKYNCSEVYSTFWICFFKLLCKIHDHLLIQSSSISSFDVFNNEGLLEIAVTILKILNHETFISLWTNECKLLFSMFIDNLMSEYGIGSFMNDVCFRGLSLSTFIIFIVCDHLTGPDSNDQICSSGWIWKMYKHLINFDLMELTESNDISQILWNNIKYLEKEFEKYPLDLWKQILLSIKAKWTKNLGENYLLSMSTESILNYCPNCKENIQELLSDIIISSTSNMIADCTEG